jgi:hypothetical protein
MNQSWSGDVPAQGDVSIQLHQAIPRIEDVAIGQALPENRPRTDLRHDVPSGRRIKEIEVMVADVVVETPDTATLVLFTGNDKLDYRAGHFLTIDPHQFEAIERVTAYLEDCKGYREPARAYSRSSAPHERSLAITVKEERYAGAISSVRAYEYDLGGNRTRALRDGTSCTYSHDEENRLFLERCLTGGGGQLTGTPVVSSTKPGHSAAALTDGETTDNPSARKAWRNNEHTAGPIFAGLDFGTPKTVSEIRFFIPTMEGNEGAAGMRRFKVIIASGIAMKIPCSF